MNLALAIRDFRTARRQAALENIINQLTGKQSDLLSYEEVRRNLKVSGEAEKGLQEVPLDSIVGSLGRYSDFTRTFLPRRDSDEHRWANVQVAVTGLVGVPPISVYQINKAYFVIDGNHRVSVARQLGAKYIEAYVTEVRTRVPLSRKDNLNDILRKAEHADFLERTNLDKTRPGSRFKVTVPGKYWIMETQIEAYCYLLNEKQTSPYSFQEAAALWYDEVYRPNIIMIRERGILQEFPRRTETDLYIWIADHRAALKESLGWDVSVDNTITDLTDHFGTRLPRVVERLTHHILNIITLDDKHTPPKNVRPLLEQGNHLFTDILVGVTDNAKGWLALDQALLIAKINNGRLLGLHVFPSAQEIDRETVRALKEKFEARCQQAGISGEFAIDSGKPGSKIVERAKWADLVVVPLNHPPTTRLVERMNSGFYTLIRQSVRPVFAITETASTFKAPLVAYDGSSKSKQALFLATYIAGRWQLSLTVVTVGSSKQGVEVIKAAQDYVEQYDIQATYIMTDGPIAQTILRVAEEQASDFIVIGAYGSGSVLDAVLGSTVNELLQKASKPVLICN